MKLPNFLSSKDFARLKSAMGIPRDKLGQIRALDVRRVGASREELRKLAGEGLEVDKDDVVSLPDGTLSFKDRRVLLYIRDVAHYGGNYSDPKFHISDCSTLRQMRENLRFGRFVIASREDGFFELNYVESQRRIEKRLDVCQNCLDRLKYKTFELGMRSDVRRRAVQEFSIVEFFQTYPKNLHHFTPEHTDWTAPINDYSADFARISLAFRQKSGWKCEDCGITLGEGELRRYLHVHHVNGLKNDNREENLRTLCVHCHSLQPAHGHLTASLHYKQFKPIWHQWRRST